MARTKTYYSNKKDNRQLRLELTQVPDIATNTSRIDWKFISEGNTSDATLYLVCETWIKINGEQVYHKGLTNWYGTGTPERPAQTFPAAEGSKSGSVTVKHNADGSLTIPIYFKTAVFTSAQHKDYGGNWELDKIPRGATITGASNFNDEASPTITYSNPAGSSVEALDIAVYDPAGSTSYAAYRAASKTGTTYTFNFTDAERKKLRQAATANTLNVRFYLRTKIGGNNYYSSVEKTMTIINGNPTMSPTVVDTNSVTKALTGDANKLVRYYSNAYYVMNAAAIKEASLLTNKATHNGVVLSTSTGTFNGIGSGTFTFEAKDSRKNVTTKTITKTLIEYVKLTCNHKVRISAEGVATIDVSGNYFNGSFGATANTLTVQYRYKLQGGTYSSWANMTIEKDGNTYTATATKSGLDYQKAYVFQCQAIDKLATVPTEERTLKALPVFDWGENDFHVHGNLIVEGTVTHSNAIAAMTLDEAVDTIIEYGNNGSYGYKKWSSGLLEAWRTAASAVSVTSDNTSGAMYYTDQVTLRTNGYASQFVSLENVQITVNKNEAIGLWQPIIARSNVEEGVASVDVFFTNTVKDATASIVPYVYFIGRWK